MPTTRKRRRAGVGYRYVNGHRLIANRESVQLVHAHQRQRHTAGLPSHVDVRGSAGSIRKLSVLTEYEPTGLLKGQQHAT